MPDKDKKTHDKPYQEKKGPPPVTSNFIEEPDRPAGLPDGAYWDGQEGCWRDSSGNRIGDPPSPGE